MANNRIAYGLAKRYGIDTTGKSPKEVWDALKEKGLTEKDAAREYREGNEKEREKLEKRYGGEKDGLPLKGKDRDEAMSEAKVNFFYDKMTRAKASVSAENRWRVDIHDIEDYKNDKLYVSEGGSCVAIEPSGNIISVCRHDDDKTIRGKNLVEYAIKNGGDRLDSFGKRLYEFYTKQGFEPVSWTPFDEKYAPDGWDKNRDKKEPIIFYKYTGEVTRETFEEFKSRVKPSQDYNTAMSIRDEEIKK